MEVKIKRMHSDAVLPTYATDGSCALDLTATSKEIDEYGNICYGVGWAFEIPKGYVGLLFTRSTNAKKDLSMLNAVGVLDSDFRGEVTFKYRPIYFTFVNRLWEWVQKYIMFKETIETRIENALGNDYEIGDRVGQILIVKHPKIKFIESDELSSTERGCGSYGSTGK